MYTVHVNYYLVKISHSIFWSEAEALCNEQQRDQQQQKAATALKVLLQQKHDSMAHFTSVFLCPKDSLSKACQ